VVGPEISSAHLLWIYVGNEIWTSVAHRLIGASGREEAPLRPLNGGAFTQR
jgi:hypothetical protein